MVEPTAPRSAATAPAVAEVLAARDNDYRPWVADFEARTGLPWHAPTPPTLWGTSISVVIPAYNAAHSLPTVLDALAAQATGAPVEVIVVDDASDDSTPDIVAAHPVVTRALRLPHRCGAGPARNAGIRLASGETVVFMDADVVPPPHVLADFSARATDRLVLLGFRHAVPYRPGPHGRALLPSGRPRLDMDHRVRWRAPVGVPALPDGRVYGAPVVLWPLDNTRDLLDLGFGVDHHGWDLPYMVVTGLLAVPCRILVDIGGFAPDFDASGWGGEDTYLGALLIAAGCKVAPLRQAVAFHIDPPDPAAAWAGKLPTWMDRATRCRRLLARPAEPEAARRSTAELLVHARSLRG